ncbi:hypothetical protein GG804_02300 [Sphingomonas histidinilytica]|uniref:hypothetical protein n=1 Tax=Sphingomonadales TaxID=204457 RepID=UPI00076FEE3F|nr:MULTISPECIES: hypothetical protein [Sphingomonadaceae]AMK23184.1 hypothetical protein K426_11230 [Sphingobium sp. TKS]MBO9375586.1 hypothetical protein [Rhizorhabdus histidinilytica]MCF8707581.1 hypothetical protein [Rhizorhapis sp. SPR117]
MSENRRILSLCLQDDEPAENDPDENVFAHAIANHLCVRVTHNRGLMILAPHVVFTRGGERFVDAVVIERNGERPAEPKLDMLKFSSLKGPVITSEPFFPFQDYDAGDDRYAEKIIARIDS